MTTPTPWTAADRDPLPFRDPAFLADPFPWYAALRDRETIARLPGGDWAVTGYHEVAALQADPRLGVHDIDFGPATPLHDTVLGQDPPEHTRLRRPLAKWLSPKFVRQWREVAQAEVKRALDALDAAIDAGVEGADTFDAVWQLTFPVTFRTTCHMLGIEPKHGERIRTATYDFGYGLSVAATDRDIERAHEAFADFGHIVDEAIEAIRAEPNDGMLADLIALEGDGRLSDAELRASTLLLLSVGHQDISYLMLNGLRIFAERPDVFARYRDEPERRAAIVDEMLRIDAPEHFSSRIALEPIEFEGHSIAAGDIVLLFMAAGNRDPRVYDRPDEFEADRDHGPSKHLSFSGGTHGCAGQMLARAEAHALFEAMAERYSSIEIAGERAFNHTEFVRAIDRLPLRVVRR